MEATRAGFEPAVFSVTGRYAEPLHQRAILNKESQTLKVYQFRRAMSSFEHVRIHIRSAYCTAVNLFRNYHKIHAAFFTPICRCFVFTLGIRVIQKLAAFYFM